MLHFSFGDWILNFVFSRIRCLCHTFVFGDIGLRRKKTKNLKKLKTYRFQPWRKRFIRPIYVGKQFD